MKSHVPDPFRPRRRPTRVVQVGPVSVGGDNPIRVQSMTTTYTHDVEGTLGQIERLVAAGCEIARVTVPTLKDAQALPAIRAGMQLRGLEIPLVADIHFSPKLALLAVEHVEKVRINPGNFTDKKRFEQRSYSDEEYAAELSRIEERFRPLVLAAQKRGIAMRIGTNHGSLSDRIVNRFGDSPQGMVESALEFVRMCRKHDYHELLISMKASNTRVMIEAYRLLAVQMAEEGMDYPFHLGVTEAGDGDDARIKSAIGIGSLLRDGIGDTVRVSLTEDPVAEVPVGFALAARAGEHLPAPAAEGELPPYPLDGHHFPRRAARKVEQGDHPWGGNQEIRVELALGSAAEIEPTVLEDLAGVAAGERRVEVISLDVAGERDVAAVTALRAFCRERELSVVLSGRVARSCWTQPAALAGLMAQIDRFAPLEIEPSELPALAQALTPSGRPSLLLEGGRGDDLAASARELVDLAIAAEQAGFQQVGLALAGSKLPLVSLGRVLVAGLAQRGLELPLLLTTSAAAGGDQGIVDASLVAGGLFTDGIGDAIQVVGVEPSRALALGYGILQGARRRTTQTEYISCPGCGRTLFELEPVTAEIKKRTSHLKGLKIAVMGCVVNGPGEMADADFGYVGWKPGKVNLYVGQECVVRDVPEDEAPDRLVKLIRDEGRWVEPDPVRGAPLPLAH